jgi:hypothetical protein
MNLYNTLKKYLRHYLKRLIGRDDPTWLLDKFQQGICQETIISHDHILQMAESYLACISKIETEENYANSTDPVVRQGWKLKKKILSMFQGAYSSEKGIRILIHIQDFSDSPGGYSALSNLLESLRFIGVQTNAITSTDNTREVLETFQPNILLSTDIDCFLEEIDWSAVHSYRHEHRLDIGLLTDLEENPRPLELKFKWAKKHGIRFYFSYRTKNYIDKSDKYEPFRTRGYPVLSMPFGVNILHYYPVPNINRILNYSLITSASKEKAGQYLMAKDIMWRYPGFIYGLRWKHSKSFSFDKDRDRYIYAMSKCGLNFHLPFQLDSACEVNERTYQLAACGVPQLVDNAKLLTNLYSTDAFFVARNRKEFFSFFQKILANHEIVERKTLAAQKEAFERYTTFHRTATFVEDLLKIYNNPS